MIVIIGESGSGKSTLVKAFMEKNKEYKKVITYTTRPMRKGEKADSDYHFVTKEEFDKLIEEDFFVEYNVYRGWYYGTALQDCSSDNDTVAILTPAGYRAIIRAGIIAYAVYLYVDRRSRLINILKRGDDIEEAYRRSLSDVGQFDGLLDEADFIIDNTQYKMSINQAVLCLEEIIKAINEVSEDGN